MKWKILNPPSSTAFLRLDHAHGRDWLVDMQGAEASLEASLCKAGSALERIAVLLITHQHTDHFFPRDALTLARGGTEICIGRACWEALPATLAQKPERAAERPALQPLMTSGRLHFLEPCGSMRRDGREVAWATWPHGDGEARTPNLAFRVDDHVFSGDTTLPAFFDPRVPGSDEVLGLRSGEKVRTLALNIAQLSRAEIEARTDLGPQRTRNYLENHGILEDLEAALVREDLRAFFENLEVLVPHHLRRAPLAETECLIAARLEAIRKRMGFGFEVRFR